MKDEPLHLLLSKADLQWLRNLLAGAFADQPEAKKRALRLLSPTAGGGKIAQPYTLTAEQLEATSPWMGNLRVARSGTPKTAPRLKWGRLPRSVEPLRAPSLPLTRQYPRLLPLKWALRVIASEANEDWPPLWKVESAITDQGAEQYMIAERLGRRTGRLPMATGFPLPDRSLDVTEGAPFAEQKSVWRFMRFFIGRLPREGTIEGLGQELGLLVVRREWSKEPTVALTEAGVRLAQMANNFLDGCLPEPLSIEECRFIVEHVRRHRPAEFEQMGEAIRALRAAGDQGLRSSDLWDRAMRDFYARYRTARGRAGPRLGVVRVTSQSALLGRLSDLGLVETSGKARAITYRLVRDRSEALSLGS